MEAQLEAPILTETPAKKPKATRPAMSAVSKFATTAKNAKTTLADNVLILQGVNGKETADDQLSPVPANGPDNGAVDSSVNPSSSAETGKIQVTKEGKAAASKNLKTVTGAVKKMDSTNKDAKRTSMDWPDKLQDKIKMAALFRGKKNMKEYLISLVEADINSLPGPMKAALDIL